LEKQAAQQAAPLLGAVSGTCDAQARREVRAAAAVQCEFLPHVDLSGNDLDYNLKTTDAEGCAALCLAVSECTHFTYIWGNCYPKTSGDGAKSANDGNAMSGACTASPNGTPPTSLRRRRWSPPITTPSGRPITLPPSALNPLASRTRRAVSSSSVRGETTTTAEDGVLGGGVLLISIVVGVIAIVGAVAITRIVQRIAQPIRAPALACVPPPVPDKGHRTHSRLASKLRARTSGADLSNLTV
jgi:hypothetical protein